MTEPIRFDDGAGYEQFMGRWSRLVGRAFLEWLAPEPGWHWLDIGCGNGAFTDLLVSEAAPASVVGIDPSPDQLAYARARLAAAAVPLRFEGGDAQALPVATGSVDVAVMPLVLFFVPDPALGVAEMVRVVRPGGLVTAYLWDMEGGGFPYHDLHARIREQGGSVPLPPHPEVSRLDVLERLWRAAGLHDVAVATYAVTRAFDDFDEYWQIVQGGPSAGQSLRAMSEVARASLREAVRATMPPDDAGRLVVHARAHAVRGRVPHR